MILDASDRGAKEIIIGLGGSARNDGVCGMARAVGFRVLAGKKELTETVSELVKLTEILLPERSVGALVPSAQSRNRRLTQPPLQPEVPKITAAADVRNPLLGKNGATRVFGPQKGATEDEI